MGCCSPWLLISTTAALGCAVATLVDCSRPWLALDLHHDRGCSRLVCARPGGWPLQGCAPLSTSPSGHDHGDAEPCAPSPSHQVVRPQVYGREQQQPQSRSAATVENSSSHSRDQSWWRAHDLVTWTLGPTAPHPRGRAQRGRAGCSPPWLLLSTGGCCSPGCSRLWLLSNVAALECGCSRLWLLHHTAGSRPRVNPSCSRLDRGFLFSVAADLHYGCSRLCCGYSRRLLSTVAGSRPPP